MSFSLDEFEDTAVGVFISVATTSFRDAVFLHRVLLDENGTIQEQQRWYISYSTGPLPAGKVNVTVAAFGREPDGCDSLPVVSASPEDGCLALRNAQQVRNRCACPHRPKPSLVPPAPTKNTPPQKPCSPHFCRGRVDVVADRFVTLTKRRTTGCGIIEPYSTSIVLVTF